MTKAILSLLLTSLLALPAFAYPARSADKDKCFDGNERADLEKTVDRMTVVGCTHDIVKPVSYIDSEDAYVPDGTYSIYDCAKYRKSFKKRLPTSMGLSEFLDDSRTALENPTNEAAQKCVVNTLNKWADADGYSEIRGSDLGGTHIRAWNMGSMAAAWLKNKTAIALADSLGKKDKITSWFQARGNQILKDANSTSQFNNVYYWRGFALLTLGIASREIDMVSKSKAIFDKAIGDIQMSGATESDRGWLPKELARKNKASHYHLFALEPILGMVAYSKYIDCNFLKSSQEDDLEALIQKLAEAEQDYNVFKNKTGVAQDKPDEIEPEKFFILLGDDTQAMRMIKHIEKYLVDNRGFHLKPQKTPSGAGQLGGSTLFTPEPGSRPISKSTFVEFCK